jgi:hypothetical protein
MLRCRGQAGVGVPEEELDAGLDVVRLAQPLVEGDQELFVGAGERVLAHLGVTSSRGSSLRLGGVWRRCVARCAAAEAVAQGAHVELDVRSDLPELPTEGGQALPSGAGARDGDHAGLDAFRTEVADHLGVELG